MKRGSIIAYFVTARKRDTVQRELEELRAEFKKLELQKQDESKKELDLKKELDQLKIDLKAQQQMVLEKAK